MFVYQRVTMNWLPLEHNLSNSIKLQTPASRIKKGAEALEKELDSGEGHKCIHTCPPRQKDVI